MESELKTYEEQLEQVTEALAVDPTNFELSTLRDELANLVALTKSLIEEQGTSTSSATAVNNSSAHAASSLSSSPSRHRRDAGPSSSDHPQQPLLAGDECSAKYAGDGRWYPAKVTSVGGSAKDPVYSIVFKGYKTTEMVRSRDIRATSTKHVGSTAVPVENGASASTTEATTVPQSSHSQPSKRPVLSAEEEAERERKRKRNEKKAERQVNKAQEASDKASSWQKFANKGTKKGYGVSGAKKQSMFRTPEDPLAKVGVVGAGKPTTASADRAKLIHRKDAYGEQ